MFLTHWQPAARSIGAETSPVNAPLVFGWRVCAPRPTWVPSTSEATAASAVKGGQMTTSTFAQGFEGGRGRARPPAAQDGCGGNESEEPEVNDIEGAVSEHVLEERVRRAHKSAESASVLAAGGVGSSRRGLADISHLGEAEESVRSGECAHATLRFLERGDYGGRLGALFI